MVNIFGLSTMLNSINMEDMYGMKLLSL